MNVDSLRGRFWQCTLPTCQKRPRRWKAKTTAWVGWSVEAALRLSLDTGIVHADVGVICFAIYPLFISRNSPGRTTPKKSPESGACGSGNVPPGDRRGALSLFAVVHMLVDSPGKPSNLN